MNNKAKKSISIITASVLGIAGCSNNSNENAIYPSTGYLTTQHSTTTESNEIISEEANNIINTTSIDTTSSVDESSTTYDTEYIITTPDQTYETIPETSIVIDDDIVLVEPAISTDEDITTEDYEELDQEIEDEEIWDTEDDLVTTNATTSSDEVIYINEDEEEIETLDEEELILALEDYEKIIMNEATNGTKESLKEKLDAYFTATVGFIFCNEPIKGKRLSELSESAKTKICSITDNINDTIEKYYPDYKITIKDKFNTAKEWTKDKFKSAGSILKKEVINTIGQEKFDNLKVNYEKTKNIIKDLGSKAIDGVKDIAESGIEKIKNWYHNKTK